MDCVSKNAEDCLVRGGYCVQIEKKWKKEIRSHRMIVFLFRLRFCVV